MTAIDSPQGLTSRKTTIEDRGWYLQTTNLSMTKRLLSEQYRLYIHFYS
jgi:hypothetical protein